jgi:hypothetical protein
MPFLLPLFAMIPIGILIALAVVSQNNTGRILAICGAMAVLVMAVYFTWKRQHGGGNG